LQVPVDRYVQVPVYVDRYVDRYIDRPVYVQVQEEKEETQSVGVGLSLERADGVRHHTPTYTISHRAQHRSRMEDMRAVPELNAS
jgi:hypothetical protein